MTNKEGPVRDTNGFFSLLNIAVQHGKCPLDIHQARHIALHNMLGGSYIYIIYCITVHYRENFLVLKC